MPKYLGLDIGPRSVRCALLNVTYRRAVVSALLDVPIPEGGAVADALRSGVEQLGVHGESVAVSFEGEKTFVRNVELPATAQKQIAEVLPFELESDLPLELSDTVFDHLVLRQVDGEPIRTIAVIARADDVRQRIDQVNLALQVEPERVCSGPFSLSALAPSLPSGASGMNVALLDIDEQRTDFVLLERGEPIFARTLSRGTAGLPQSAHALARELKQTLLAARAVRDIAPEVLYLAGTGASSPGALEFIAAQLGIHVQLLSAPGLELAEGVAEGEIAAFAKAVGLALSLAPRSRSLNLRRGALSYERGFGFLREKVPLLSGLCAVILVSFLFSTWAEMRALSQERSTLQAGLAALTKEVFKEETSDPEHAMELLDKGPGSADEDPLPHADAFDVLVQLSQAIPENMTHDIEELDVQRGHVVVHGIVSTIPDAQQIAQSLKAYRCFQDVKIVRTNQAVGEDRQKYVLELDIKCPNEKDKSTAAPSSSSGTTGSKP